MRRWTSFLVLVSVLLVYPGVGRAQTVVTTRHVKIVMDDGVRIDANVFSPAPLADLSKPGAQLPALVTQSPYRKPISPGEEISFLVRRGYVVVATDVRGTGDSEGEWNAWTLREHVDGKNVVEWAASQPWSIGKVGLFGTSYLGINQYLTASQRPRGLVAMVPTQAWSDIYVDAAYRGGSQGILDSTVFGAYVTILQGLPPSTLLDGGSDDPVRDVTLVWLRHLLALWTVEQSLEVRTHSTNDGFWKERSVSSKFTEIASTGGHVMHVGGWYDLFPRAIVNNYLGVKAAGEALAARDATFVPGRQKLVMGPWVHGSHRGAGVGDEAWGFWEARADWFDRWIKGIQNGIDADPPVRLYVPGAERWVLSESWPPPGFDSPTTLHLRSGPSGSAVSLNDGRLLAGAPGDEAPDSYLAEPASGFAGGPLLIRGSVPVVTEPQDQRLEEPKELTYTTDPFDAPKDLVGPIRLVLYASSSASDTYWVARLVRVRADGSTELLTRGWLRASHRESHETPSDIQPGRVYAYEIEIWPTARRFAPGERLRLDLSSADVPLQSPVAQAAMNTVYHDALRPSALIVPLRAAT